MKTHPTLLRSAPPLAAGTIAVAMALAAPAALADEKVLEAQLRALTERMQRLEARNEALERALRERDAKPSPAGASTAAEPAPEHGHDDGETPGVEVEASVVALAQGVSARGGADGRAQRRLNYRGDLGLTLPLPDAFGATVSAFGHLRFGQGTGIGLRPTFTSTANSTAFETAAGPDDSFGVLAQAWLQLRWPLSEGSFDGHDASQVELTFGKMDLFGFFDQNAVAADEAGQFLNNAFVHNPLLDSGGDIAADAYGFAPGARVAFSTVREGWRYGVSAGVFGAGAGANFSAAPSRPLVIVQAELAPLLINGEPRGSWRLYGWTNGRTTDLAGAEQRHSGWGLSVDQRVGAAWNLFGRVGQRTRGDGAFDRALTVGAEHGGRSWGRGADAVGVAVGTLRADPASGMRGSERLAELYYRWQLNEKIALTPDLQWIRRPAADAAAPGFSVWGLRALVSF